MLNNQTILICVAALLLGLILGFLVSTIFRLKGKQKYIAELTQITAENSNLQQQLQQIKTFNENQKQQLNESFQALSAQVLKQNSESFLQLANESLGKFHQRAQGDLEKKEQSIDALLKPIKETLQKTHEQIHLMEKERKQAYGSLKEHLTLMAETQKDLHTETRNLVQAFRRPEVRGQWGELTLKRLAELSGMIEHCDFIEQNSVITDEGKQLRPDMIIKMPAGREIIVDSKTPLDAYLDAIEAKTEQEKDLALERHVRQVKQRIKELATKAYWSQFSKSLDFVVLFIPGDQFLNAALDKDRNLLEDALKHKVIISTPTSFVALLRAVAYGWRQETLAKNADIIRQLGAEFHHRIAVFSENLNRLGKSLDQSVTHYNKSLASFSSRILPTARKFETLGVEIKKEISEVDTLEKMPQTITSDTE